MDKNVAQLLEFVFGIALVIFGIVPLLQYVFFDGRTGLLGRIFGVHGSPEGWLTPLVIGVVSFGVLAWVDSRKSATS